MPALDKASFLQRIDILKEDLDHETSYYIERLNEKGVECSILVPLFETLLGFDALKDIQYEYTSNKRFERFDFLIDKRFIVEAKKMGTPIESKIKDQINKYIAHHDNINYGMLSNGSDYAFFIQKTFIEEFLKAEDKLKINFEKKVFHVLTIDIYDDHFYEIIKLFSKDTYHETFSRIARYALTVINKSKSTKICEDKELNSYIQEKIETEMDIKHGEFLKEIESKTITVGQKIQYKNSNVEITLEILKDGRLKLSKGDAKIFNMMDVMGSEFKAMIDVIRDEWIQNDIVFSNTKEVIKIATSKERVNMDKYKFVKI